MSFPTLYGITTVRLIICRLRVRVRDDEEGVQRPYGFANGD